jgi:hypothetical protein
LALRTGEKPYQVHYQGWKKRFDEWVDASLVFESNAANIRKQQDLLLEAQEMAEADAASVKRRKMEYDSKKNNRGGNGEDKAKNNRYEPSVESVRVVVGGE